MGIKKAYIILFAIIFSALSCAPPHTAQIQTAQTKTSKDDTEFIRKLINRGYCDSADEMLDRISKDACASDKVKAELPLLKAENLTKKSEKEKDPVKSKELLKAASGQLKEYIKGNPQADALFNVEICLVTILLHTARLAADTRKTEPNPDKLPAINQEVESLYAEAIGKLKELLNDLNTADDQENAREDLLYCYSKLARAMYEYAIDTTADKKEAAIDAAIRFILEDLQFCYPMDFLGYESGIFGGLCYKEKARLTQDPDEKAKYLAEAARQFDYAISLKEAYANQNEPLDDYAKHIISTASFLKGQLFNPKQDEK